MGKVKNEGQSGILVDILESGHIILERPSLAPSLLLFGFDDWYPLSSAES